MITRISIENFKGIRERVTLDVRPITLLFGGNSAGKSTVMHALLYFYEVFINHNLDVGQTDVGGNTIDLGGFRNLQSDHDFEKPIVLRVDCTSDAYFNLEEEFQFGSFFQAAVNLLGIDADEIVGGNWIKQVGVELTIAWHSEKRRPFVKQSRLFFEDEWFAIIQADAKSDGVLVTDLNLRHSLLAFPRSVPESDFINTKPRTTLGVFWRLFCGGFKPVDSDQKCLRDWRDAGDFARRPFELELDSALRVENLGSEALNSGDGYHLAKAFHDVLAFYFDIAFECLKDHLTSVKFIGPIRAIPPRDWARHIQHTSWADGLATWDILHRGSDALVKKVGHWFADEDKLNAGLTVERIRYVKTELGLNSAHDMNPAQVKATDPSVRTRVVLKPNGTCVQLTLRDVGTGISQLMPIVVGVCNEEDCRTFLIEQPELHVHPRLQAAMGDLFIESIHACGHTYIIETHSEHLILRLLRRIRETEKGTAPADRQLRTNELGIYYLKQENGSSTASRIDVDVKGEFIQPWPDDFFEIDFFERFA